MSNIQFLKKKIETVKNIQKVTRAIKMVATVRTRKAQQALQTSRTIPQNISEIMSFLANSEIYREAIQHPLLKQRKEISHSIVLVVSNDHGLCGGFATRVASRALEVISKKDINKKYYIISIGNRGTSYLKSKGIQISEEYQNFFTRYTLDKVYHLVDSFVNSYLSQVTDEIVVVYTSLRPSYTTEVVVKNLLPISIEEITQAKSKNNDRRVWLIEPNTKIILNELVKLYLVSELNRIFHESFASEQLARMQAMDTASTNAEKLLEKIKIDFNKIRQELITKEVIEVISGSDKPS